MPANITGQIRQDIGNRWILESTIWPWPRLVGTYKSKQGAIDAAKRKGIKL